MFLNCLMDSASMPDSHLKADLQAGRSENTSRKSAIYLYPPYILDAIAQSDVNVELQLQDGLTIKLDEQETAIAVSDWATAKGAVATPLDQDYDKVLDIITGNNTKLVELNKLRIGLDQAQNDEVEQRNQARLTTTVDQELTNAADIDYKDYTDNKAQLEKLSNKVDSVRQCCSCASIHWTIQRSS